VSTAFATPHPRPRVSYPARHLSAVRLGEQIPPRSRDKY
jgi:hypothetical protein